MKLLIAMLVACSSASPPPAVPSPPSVAVVIDAATDAATDAAAPDAGLPASVLAAPAWIFHYATRDRTETWTLQVADGQALLVVDGAQHTRYTGTAIDHGSLAIEVTSPTAKLSLDCKHERRPLSVKCNDTKAKPVEVLACYHPDFKSPMTFGAAPGIEYVVDATCNGFRLQR